jgi:antitoxin (DNA-binding transcriptional repressor) of toxin-antitoxin stability system
MNRRITRITNRELRNESGRIMRALDKGKAFVVTRNGVPVGELIPLRQRLFVASDAVLAAFAGAPRVARVRFRKDLDVLIDQDLTPRG